MSFIAAEPQDNVGLALSLGRPTLFSHVKTSLDTTLYDLPMQNIERAIELQHAGQNFSEISAEEANKRYGIEGHVKFDKPIAWRKAELINKYKREELERFQELALGNDTLFRKSTFFVSSIAGQALDPINLAAMFIPVVGEAKFARLVQKVGVTRARLIAGAAEAAVGMAVVEPMSYLSKTVGEQNVYGPQDTVMNLVLGTIMGTGLRVAGGKVKDRFFGKYDAQAVLDEINLKKTKVSFQEIHKRVLKEAEFVATKQGLKKGTRAFDEAVLDALTSAEDVLAEIDLIHQTVSRLDPTVHKKAFTEGLNNLLNDEPIVGPKIEVELAQMEQQRQQMKLVNQVQEATGQLKVEATAAGTEIKSGKAKVVMQATDEAVHLKILERGENIEDLQGIIYGQAKAALKSGQELVIDDVKMDREALKVFVHGTDTAAVSPQAPEPKPKNIWDDVEPSDHHVDLDTPEARKVTADEINAQADEIQKALSEFKDAAPEESANALDELTSLFDEYDIPEDIRQQILDDFEAPDRLQQEQAGIEAAIDCVIRNMI